MKTEEQICWEYLKDQMLNGPLPEGTERRPTEEEINQMPEVFRNHFIQTILGYPNKTPLIKKIIEDVEKKFDDRSLGIRVKQYLKQYIKS